MEKGTFVHDRREVKMMESFVPKRVYYEPAALDYELGRQMLQTFRREQIPVLPTTSHNRVTGLPGNNAAQGYGEAKKTLVVGVRRGETFQTYKPSAHYQLPLATSCPGMCEYCYLATTLGQKPYLRVYVNVDEILAVAQSLIEARAPEITIFEGAATSDPIPVEKYTGSLRKTIEFFGRQPHGRFRLVTKFTEVSSLLDAEHRGHTRFRFSLNTEQVIRKFEHGTPDAGARIEAARIVYQAGYPLGFIVAPIFRYEGWQQDYQSLFRKLKQQLGDPLLPKTVEGPKEKLTFELITHRFTTKAKGNILRIFPTTTLPMEEEDRNYKYGQFGYGKYLYPKEEMAEMKEAFHQMVEGLFPEAEVNYFI